MLFGCFAIFAKVKLFQNCALVANSNYWVLVASIAHDSFMYLIWILRLHQVICWILLGAIIDFLWYKVGFLNNFKALETLRHVFLDRFVYHWLHQVKVAIVRTVITILNLVRYLFLFFLIIFNDLSLGICLFFLLLNRCSFKNLLLRLIINYVGNRNCLLNAFNRLFTLLLFFDDRFDIDL